MIGLTGILKRELIAVLRTRRAFWLLVVAVGAMALVPLLEWPSGMALRRDSSCGDRWRR